MPYSGTSDDGVDSGALVGEAAFNYSHLATGLSNDAIPADYSKNELARFLPRARHWVLTRRHEHVGWAAKRPREITVSVTADSTTMTSSGLFSDFDIGRICQHHRAFKPGTAIASRSNVNTVTLNQAAAYTYTGTVTLADAEEPYDGEITQYLLFGEIQSGTNNNVGFGTTIDQTFFDGSGAWGSNKEMFLYNNSTGRTLITDTLSTGSNYFCDPASPVFREYFKTKLHAYWDASGERAEFNYPNGDLWDGLFLDNVPMSYQVYTKRNPDGVVYPYAGGVAYTPETWRQAVYDFLDYIIEEVCIPRGKTVWANIIERTTDVNRTALISSDLDGTIRPSGAADATRGLWWRGIMERLAGSGGGALIEYFGNNPSNYSFHSRDEFYDWCVQMAGYATNDLGMNTIMVGRSDLRSAGSSTDDVNGEPLRNMAFAHYLLFANDKTAFRWGDEGGYTDVFLWPDYFLKAQALGAPKGKLYQPSRISSPHIWRRDFANGYVVVDHTVSGTPTQSITLA